MEDGMMIFKKGEKFFAHQEYAIEHLKKFPNKSAMLCYGMGTGKTYIVAEYATNHFNGKVVFMGPKALHPVFTYHVEKCGGSKDTKLEGGHMKFGLVTSEASNVYEQMRTQLMPILGPMREDVIETLEADEFGEPVMRNVKVLLIMDECHLFSTRVAHILSNIHYSDKQDVVIEEKEKQAYKLYRLLCHNPYIRIVAMTGTPVKTHPFNFVPIANIIRKGFISADGKRSVAFPEVFGRFHDAFVADFIAMLDEDGLKSKKNGTKSKDDKKRITSDDEDEGHVTFEKRTTSDKKRVTFEMSDDIESGKKRVTSNKNDDDYPNFQEEVIIKKSIPTIADIFKVRGLETFATRMRGLILWYDAPQGLDNIPFPVVESEEYVEIPMGAYQWKLYRAMEEEEARIERSMRSERNTRSDNVPIVGEDGVYRSLTRNASNFVFPEKLYGLKSTPEMLAAMPDSAFELKNVGMYGCKVERIISNIFKMKDRIHGVFSYFVHGSGLAVIKRCLKVAGWKSLNDLVSKYGTFAEVKQAVGKDAQLYMELTGDTAPGIKTLVNNIFNEEDNTKTNLIRVVLYSGAAAHGLTFNSGRVIHFLEPAWDDTEEAQARQRFIRINAAAFLPPKDRTIKVFYYIAVHPSRMEETTDQHLRLVAERKARLNFFLVTWMKTAAVNCSGCFLAENRLHGSLIKAGKVPPLRTFMHCLKCSGQYVGSYFLQGVTDAACTHTEVRGTKMDRSTGLAWIDGLQVIDPIELRRMWQKELKK